MVRHMIALAVALALCGCGGGGGGGSGSGTAPVVAAPTPAPTPAPSPTPSPAGPVPFGLTQNAALQVIALQTGQADQPAFERWLAPGELSLTWLAAEKTFDMRLPANRSGRLEDDPNEAAPSARFLVHPQAGRQAKVNIFIPTPAFGASDFVLPGSWNRLDNEAFPDWTRGEFLFFTADSVRTPPTAGAASYRFGPDPSLRARLAFDFAAGTVSGEVPLTWSDAWGPYPEVRYAVHDGRYDRTTGSFSGAFDIPGSGFAGEFRGQIVGANGQAMAIAIRGATFDPYAQKWVPAHTLGGHLRE